ncbi:hypothetical protein JX266_008230 [Neoarthrinium moseri]|nr:hypothetical protein JX266_008230 [Neoarthrinium moseri]
MDTISLTLHRSNGSISIQPLLDDDKVYLPDSDVFVTTTKSGKPALARKKKENVLRDHGFDLLGQSFGISSRADFQRGRRPSIVSQASRSRSARSTPAPRIFEVDTDGEESILAAKARVRQINEGSSSSSSRSTSRPRGILRHPKTYPQAVWEEGQPQTVPDPKHRPRSFSQASPTTNEPSERIRFARYDSEEESPRVSEATGAFYIPLGPPHVHPYPGIAASNIIHDQALGQYGYPNWPLTSGYVAQSMPTDNLSRNVPIHQTQSLGISGFHPGSVAPQSTSVPATTQNQQAGAPYLQQPANFSFIPPPPPPPPGNFGTGGANTQSSTLQEDERIKDHFEAVVKPHLAARNHKGRNSEETKNSQVAVAKPGDEVHERRRRKSRRHKHVCAGCGRTRSRGYHLDHPLKRGETPEPGYCRRCTATAEYTDSEASESVSSVFMTSALPPMSTDDEVVMPVTASKSGKKTRCQKPLARNGRGSFLKAMSSVISGSHRGRKPSLSTPEEASSRASSRSRSRGRRMRRPDRSASSFRPVQTHKPRSPLLKPSSAQPLGTAKASPSHLHGPPAVNPSLASEQRARTSVESSHRQSIGDSKAPSTAVTYGRESREQKSQSVEHSSQLSQREAGSSSRNAAGLSSQRGKSDIVPNFSHKASPQRFGAASNKGSHESVPSTEAWYQQPVPHDERSELAQKSRCFSSLDPQQHSGRHNHSLGDEAIDKPATSRGLGRKGNESAPPAIKDKPVSNSQQETFDIPPVGRSNSPTRSNVSASPSSKIGSGCPGIFEKAPNFDELLERSENVDLDIPAMTGNAFCSWDERGDDLEPDLMSPDNDHFDSMPATPADANWAVLDTEPQVQHDSWGYDQTQYEQEAEQMVEEELMQAGKRSGLFGDVWGSSATSTHPTLSSYSHLTVSLISIESCDSDEERNDGNDHYRLSHDSENEEPEVPQTHMPNQLDFPSMEQRSQSGRGSPCSQRNSSFKQRSDSSSHVKSNKSNNSPEKNLYNTNHDAVVNNSSESFEFLPPPEGSSVLAHTGHSEEVIPSLEDKHNSNSSSPRRNLRRHIRGSDI